MLDVSDEFITALKAPVRHIHLQAKLTTRTGETVRDEIELNEGDITIDWTQRKTGLVKTGLFKLVDTDGTLAPIISEGADNDLYFDKQFRLKWGLTLADGSIEYVDVVRGWIRNFKIHQKAVTISTVDRSFKHLGTHGLKQPFVVTRGTTYADAMSDLLNLRGIDDEDLVIASTKDFKRAEHFGPGMLPWLILQEWADDLDKQLFYRENGELKLRPYPDVDDVAWHFAKGEDSIVLDWPDEGLSENEVAQNVIVVSDRFVDDGPLAADRPEPVMAFAEIDPDDPLGANTISGNHKPTQLIVERPGIRTFDEAQDVADAIRDRQLNGLHAEREIRCWPLPHLEPMDVVSTNVESPLHKFRLKRTTWSVMPEGSQVINHSKNRRPLVRGRQHRRRR